MLSSSCRYAIRAAVYLAHPGEVGDAYVPIRTISEDLGISFHFLTKILQILTQNKIVVSHRGPQGGVALARPATEVTVLEIIRCMDGEDLFSRCILGFPHCSDRHPCALHGRWRKERKHLSDMFARMTLVQLARSQGVRR